MSASASDEAPPPLGYLFWHAPAAGVGIDEYESTMLRWQEVLAAHPPPGFVRGWTLRLPAPPWLGGWPEAAYLDTYVVEDFAALGMLNAHAPVGMTRGAHDDAAGRAGHGSGALFSCRSGAAHPPGVTVTIRWHDKRPGESYPETLRRLGGPTRSVWLRQMVLGAGPEILVCADTHAEAAVGTDTRTDAVWETAARLLRARR